MKLCHLPSDWRRQSNEVEKAFRVQSLNQISAVTFGFPPKHGLQRDTHCDDYESNLLTF